MSDDVPLREHVDKLLEAERQAVKIALDAANEKAKSHNDILGAMRDQQATFVTKEQVRWAVTAMLAGVAVAVAIFAAISGTG